MEPNEHVLNHFELGLYSTNLINAKLVGGGDSREDSEIVGNWLGKSSGTEKMALQFHEIVNDTAGRKYDIVWFDLKNNQIGGDGEQYYEGTDKVGNKMAGKLSL